MGTEVHTLTEMLLSAGLEPLPYSRAHASDTSRRVSVTSV